MVSYAVVEGVTWGWDRSPFSGTVEKQKGSWSWGQGNWLLLSTWPLTSGMTLGKSPIPTDSQMCSSHKMPFVTPLPRPLRILSPNYIYQTQLHFQLWLINMHVVMAIRNIHRRLPIYSRYPCSKHTTWINYLILRTTLRGKHYYPHFTEEKTEAQRRKVTSLRSHRQ